MGRQIPRNDPSDPARELIEELLRAGLVLTDLLASLLEEIPEDAFPGEDKGEALMEMVVGSCLPALKAAGEQDCMTAKALIGAIEDRVLDDLRRAAEIARDR